MAGSKKTNRNTRGVKGKQPGKLGHFLSKRRNIAIVGMVVIFAFVGSYMAFQSKADTYQKSGYTRFSPYECRFTTLYPGSSGYCVSVLQRSLNHFVSLNGNPNGPFLDIDGYYGPRTTAMVVFYQQRNNLANDGVTGPNTWGSLNSFCQNADNCAAYIR